jgi:hypothetical protein
MKRLSLKSLILIAVIVVDTAFALFPDWEAVHPTDASLTTSLGLAWFLSPPPPPQTFNGLRVRKGTGWIWGIALTSAVGLIGILIPP